MIEPLKKQLVLVPLTDIKVNERARADYGDLNELIESIKTNGLIHPIAVMKNPDNLGYTLLAGGRRYAAFLTLQATNPENYKDIPCYAYPYMDNDLDIKTIELVENLHRKDMSFVEEVKLTEAIHNLQVARYGKAERSSAGHSIRDTATMLGRSHVSVAKDIELAEAIVDLPELGKCKNKSEALKELAKTKELMIKAEMAHRHSISVSQTTEQQVLQAICNSYKIKDVIMGLKEIPDGSVDFIELDPPYNIELRKTLELTTEQKVALMDKPIDETSYISFISAVLNECHRVLRKTGWIIMWYSMEPWHTPLYNAIKATGFEGTGTPALWIKNNGNTRTPNIHLRNYFEPFFYARKSDAMIALPGSPNIFQFPMIPGKDKEHPNEKPIELYMSILRTFAFQNAYVVSAFAGSGNCLLAASNLGMRSIGFDSYGETYKNNFVNTVMASVPGRYTSY